MENFNFILNEDEKFEEKSGGPSANNFLQDLMFDSGVIDLGFSGNQFTRPREGGETQL